MLWYIVDPCTEPNPNPISSPIPNFIPNPNPNSIPDSNPNPSLNPNYESTKIPQDEVPRQFLLGDKCCNT